MASKTHSASPFGAGPSLPGQPWSACWNKARPMKERPKHEDSLPGQPWSACWNNAVVAQVGGRDANSLPGQPWSACWNYVVVIAARRSHPSLPGQPWSACWNGNMVREEGPSTSQTRSLGNHGARVGTLRCRAGASARSSPRSLGNHGARVGTSSPAHTRRPCGGSLAPWATMERVLEQVDAVVSGGGFDLAPWATMERVLEQDDLRVGPILVGLAPWATMGRVLERPRLHRSVPVLRGSLPGQPWGACWMEQETGHSGHPSGHDSLPEQPWSACWNDCGEECWADSPFLAPWATMECVLERTFACPRSGSTHRCTPLPGQPWSACWNTYSR